MKLAFFLVSLFLAVLVSAGMIFFIDKSLHGIHSSSSTMK